MNPVTAISTVKEVYDLAKDAKEDYNCIIKWINRKFRKPIRILIVGESGTGKTQFLSAIRAKKEFILRSTMASYPCKFELGTLVLKLQKLASNYSEQLSHNILI